MKTILSTLICVLFATSLMAVTITWNGGSGSWNDPAMWSTGTVPGPGDDVDITSGKVYIPTNYNARALTISVGYAAMLVNDGTLEMLGGNNVNALDNYGKIINGGRMGIAGYTWTTNFNAGHGIINHNFFMNRYNGLLVVTGTENEAVQNNGSATFYNYGTFTIDDIQNDGLENRGTLRNSGELEITQTDENGLYNVLAGDFENRGTLAISSTGKNGIYNAANLENINQGVITIEETTEDGISTTPTSVIINAATLEINNGIGEYGIYNFGTFTNDAGASLEIEQTGSTGIFNDNIFSQLGDVVLFDIGGRGLQNADEFNNAGRMSIRETDSQGLFQEDGSFNNEGLLNIRDVNSGSGIVINGGTLRNAAQGSINLQEIALSGIQLVSLNSAQCLNYGELNIADAIGDGIGGPGSFDNFSTGEISIENVSTGISITSGADFNNSGSIVIEQLVNNGLTIVDGLFINEGDGAIYIDDAGFSGIDVRLDGHFINSEAYVKVAADVGIWALVNQGVVENLNCGLMDVHERLDNQPTGSFLNEAWIYTSHLASHTNNGMFVNEGGIGDYHGAFAGVPLQNNSVITKPITGNLQVGVPYPNVFHVGTFDFLKILGIYADPGLLFEAGDYDANNNTFTPNNNAVFSTELYVLMYHNDEECPYTFPVKVTGLISPLATPGPSGLDIAESNESAELSVFPNPTTGRINIKTADFVAGTYQVRLFDAQGKLHHNRVLELDSNGIQRIDLPADLTPALYLLQISDEKGYARNQRIIIE